MQRQCRLGWGGNQRLHTGTTALSGKASWRGPVQLLSKKFAFQAKALLCMALIITQPMLVGCQSAPITAPVQNITAARYHVELSSTDEISTNLEGTTFRGASAIDIYPAQQRFELIFPD